MLLVYVDDILTVGPDPTSIAHTRQLLEDNFKLRVLSDMHYFLGLEITHSSHGISLCRRKYALQLLDDTGYLGAKPLHTPMDSNVDLNETNGEPLADPT